MQKRIKLMMASTKLWLAAVVFISVAWQGICDESVPRITARDGILYQDGKPCFLVGVWSHCGYDDIVGFHIQSNPGYYGYVETVPGKEGNGLKINFSRTDKPINRWVDTRIYPPDWAEKKYKALKFWIKGDGSKITFSPNIGYYLSGIASYKG